MPKERISALALSGLGLLALYESTVWIRWGLADYRELGTTLQLGMSLAFCVTLAISTAASLYVFARPPGSRANPLMLAIAGCLISSIGGLESYVGVILSAQAVFYGVAAAKRTLWLFRLGLFTSVVVFTVCLFALVRAVARIGAKWFALF